MRGRAGKRESAVESVVTALEAIKNSTVTCITKVIKQEIRSICSLEHNSILRDNIEAVKRKQSVLNFRIRCRHCCSYSNYW